MSAELTMAMTPELPDPQPEFVGPLARKLSKSSVARSEDQSIPSPPLSPCHASSSSAIDSATPRQLTNELDTIILLNKSLNEFPLNRFEKFPLTISAWSNVGAKGFKKSQLNFIKQYTRSSSKTRIEKTQQRKFAPRRLVKSYETDSDYSSNFEKVRTRRLVRETSSTPSGLESIRVKTPSTPQPKKRKPTSSPMVAHTHVDWEALPDYCPDLATLPNNSRCLKVEWKGQPMSLADDPLVDKLHPAEVTLASILRLPCNVYLDSKRRLFAEKVSRMKKGLPFRRTDAQKSCRIDVNKASRLFAAFEKIGWLEDDLFEKYM